MSRKIITTEETEEDKKIEGTLRPQYLKDYIGQEKIKSTLKVSPGSIGISPLSTPHAHPFQRMWLRTSNAFYGIFILDMDRSPGFGSTRTDLSPS